MRSASTTIPKGANPVVAVLRSNLALGTSLSVALLALGAGSMIWVRHLTPNIEIAEERHDLRSAPEERKAFQREFAEGAAISQITRRPAGAPHDAARDRAAGARAARAAARPRPAAADRPAAHGLAEGPARGHPRRQLRPLRPADISTPGSLITVIPEGYQDDDDALAKAGVILIKFAPGELHVPTNYNGGTLVSTMNWTIDNIVAYSKICTHVGCPVALYEQTTHHILCPCHQSTFDAANGANVIFGPAARALPQLPLMLASEGYIAAASDFTQPVGPSFWERG